MGVRSVRFHDLLAVRRIETRYDAYVLWPSPLDAAPSATHVALASAWQDVNQTVFTFVLRERGTLSGLAQVAARRGQDAWDLVRLALTSIDEEERVHTSAALVEGVLQATSGRGGLRTFARVPPNGEGRDLLLRGGFRPYATEYTTVAERLDPTPAPLPAHLEFRARRPADAWGIFQLYCSVAPAEVRHAEGLSSKRWTNGSRLARALFGRWTATREAVLADEGMIVGWIRVTPTTGAGQRLEVMLHPRADDMFEALLAHAAVALPVHVDGRTVSHVRAYENTVLTGLRAAGFTVAEEHALFVKHAAVRVTERQLLIAALRAQGLGLDVSRYQHQPDAPVPIAVPLTPTEYALYDRTSTHR